MAVSSYTSEALVAVLVPAYNEAETIALVIEELLALGLDAELHVLENGSTDDTFEIARRAGAASDRVKVHRLPERGKGYAVRWAFENIDAQVFALVDADASYCFDRLPELVEMVSKCTVQMAVGDRISSETYRHVHGRTLRWLGNRLASKTYRVLTGNRLNDVLSGLRVIDGAMVRAANLRRRGFELEAELSLGVWALGGRIAELPTGYRGRPQGGESKLHFVGDGLKILWALTVDGLALRMARSVSRERVQAEPRPR